MNKKRVIDCIALAFILLFVYTGVAKFLDFEYFKVTIEQAAILKPMASILRWVVPLSELIIALMLATKKFRLYGFYASFILMLSFTAYVGGILKFNSQLPCSCGGIIEQMDWGQHLIFNIIFTILAGIAIWLERSSNNSPREHMQTPLPG